MFLEQQISIAEWFWWMWQASCPPKCFSQLKTLSCERSRAQRMLWLLWFETWETRRKINISPSIIFHNIIKVVRQFDLVKKINTLRQAILTSLLLFGHSTVGSPAPPPLWLVRWLESDRDERSVLSKVEHSSTLGAEKKTLGAKKMPSARHAPGVWKKNSHLEQLKKYASLGEKNALVNTQPKD